MPYRLRDCAREVHVDAPRGRRPHTRGPSPALDPGQRGERALEARAAPAVANGPAETAHRVARSPARRSSEPRRTGEQRARDGASSSRSWALAAASASWRQRPRALAGSVWARPRLGSGSSLAPGDRGGCAWGRPRRSARAAAGVGGRLEAGLDRAQPAVDLGQRGRSRIEWLGHRGRAYRRARRLRGSETGGVAGTSRAAARRRPRRPASGVRPTFTPLASSASRLGRGGARASPRRSRRRGPSSCPAGR